MNSGTTPNHYNAAAENRDHYIWSRYSRIRYFSLATTPDHHFLEYFQLQIGIMYSSITRDHHFEICRCEINWFRAPRSEINTNSLHHHQIDTNSLNRHHITTYPLYHSEIGINWVLRYEIGINRVLHHEIGINRVLHPRIRAKFKVRSEIRWSNYSAQVGIQNVTRGVWFIEYLSLAVSRSLTKFWGDWMHCREDILAQPAKRGFLPSSWRS